MATKPTTPMAARRDRRLALAIGAMALAAVQLGVLPASRAELPPLPLPALTAQADLIVSRPIVKVDVKTVTPSWVSSRQDIPESEKNAFHDDDYTITMNVLSTEKGDPSTTGKPIVFHAWRNAGRPAGWVGPGGTLQLDLHVGDKVKVYLKHGNDGWELFSYSGIMRG